MSDHPDPAEIDLIVIGATRGAVSLAIEAQEATATVALLVENSHAIGDTRLAYDLDLHVATVQQVEPADGAVRVVTPEGVFSARAVADVATARVPAASPLAVPDSMRERVHLGDLTLDTWDVDLLVVGGSEHAAEVALSSVAAGSRVVLARLGVPSTHLSRLLRGELLQREAERRLTVLWNSLPVELDAVGDELLVGFADPGTPDLVFDHVVFADPTELGVDTEAGPGPMWTLGDAPGEVAPGRAWAAISEAVFPDKRVTGRRKQTADIGELRTTHYNGTIDYFDRAHTDLWVIRVRPDHGDVAHEAGQYASLGLGYWEDRVDAAVDADLDRRWKKLVRRSYSISSPVFDDRGYLHDPARSDTLEFYIVLVPPSGGRAPGLTPRLALRGPGDRIYVGPRIVGRYTLAPVTDPGTAVVLLATGTGEAPHNAMIAELLRKGHSGPIVSVVSTRYQADLGYLEVHRRLEERFPSYHYLPIVTRDPEREKLYVQDVIEREMLADEFGVELDPSSTHVYLCGNPAMIGLPEWDGAEPRFPEPLGVCQILAERGFELDRRGVVGNVHSEKYW